MTDSFELTGDIEWSTWTHFGPAKLPVRFTPRSLDLTGTVIRAGYKELAMDVAARRVGGRPHDRDRAPCE